MLHDHFIRYVLCRNYGDCFRGVSFCFAAKENRNVITSFELVLLLKKFGQDRSLSGGTYQ